MKRKLSIALSMLLTMSCLAACGDKKSDDLSGLEIPQFEDSKGVIFTAYAGPTVEK